MQDFLFLKANGDYTRVNYSDIVFVECVKNYVRIVTAKTVFVVLITMKRIEEALPSDRFCRIHRSYIVSLNHVNRFNSKSISIGEKKLPLSDQHRELFMEKFIILTPEPRNKIDFFKKLSLLITFYYLLLQTLVEI